MPSFPSRDLPGRALRRRTVVGGLAGLAAAATAGCDDLPAASSHSPGAAGTGKQGATPAPSTDPAVVAAMQAAGRRIGTLTARYAAVLKRHPALKARLTAPMHNHAAHLARLATVAGRPVSTASSAPGGPKPVPPSAAAALAELAGREQQLAVANAVAAAKLSGQPARLLAMVAASETQTAVVLGRKATA